MKKIILTSVMFLIAMFIASLLGIIKDYVVFSSLPGLEVIAAVKSVVFGASLVFFLIYVMLSCLFDPKKLFYGITVFFIGFFVIYAFVLYPMRELLYIDMSAYIAKYPDFKSLFLLISNWSIVSFYIIADLWRSVIVSFVLWQFANYIYTVQEAKTIYPIFGIIGQIGMVLSTYVQGYIFKANNNELAWQLQWTIGMVVLAGLLFIAIYWYMNRFILIASGDAIEDDKPEMPLIKGVSYIALISIIVIASSVSIELVEGFWKSQLRVEYPLLADFSAFMGGYRFYTSLVSAIVFPLGLLLSIFVFKYFKWIIGALLTPIMMLIVGSIFFMVILNPEAEILTSMPLITPVIVGAVYNILIGYTNIFFARPFREMAYIPLNNRLKNIGKAFVDIVLARAGQICGPIILMFLSKNGNDLTHSAKEAMYIFLFIIALWIIATVSLGRLFEKRTSEVA